MEKFVRFVHLIILFVLKIMLIHGALSSSDSQLKNLNETSIKVKSDFLYNPILALFDFNSKDTDSTIIVSEDNKSIKMNPQPLILTHLINQWRLEEARDLAKVGKQFQGLESYSGFFNVNSQFNSNLFFWFFPAQTNPETAPVLLWLQGGPGESAMYGLFTEHGPYVLDASLNISERATAWTKTHSVIYMDSPVGAGFSHTDNVQGYAKTQVDVANNLYEGLLQFYELFPQFCQNDFYAGGESYGGKYVPAISYKIHNENRRLASFPSSDPKHQKINLRGLIIGNGFTDPSSCLSYGSLLHDLGLFDSKQKQLFEQEEEKTRQLIKQEKFSQAYAVMDKLLIGSKEISRPTYLEQYTGFQSIYNLLRDTDPPEMVGLFIRFVQQDSIRSVIHVGNIPFNHADMYGVTADHLHADIYDTVKPWVEHLLEAEEGYKIMYYTGNLDLCVGVKANNDLIDSFNWSGITDFFETPKKTWKVNGELAGYVKTFKSLTQIIVRNAGHRVPYDQPEFAFDMINRFTGEGW